MLRSIVFIGVFLSALTAPLASVQTNKATLAKLEQQQQSFYTNQRELSRLHHKRDQLQSKLTELESELSVLRQNRQRLAILLGNGAIRMDRQKVALATLEQSIAQKSERVSNLIKQGWRQASASSWHSFLAPKNPNELARQFAWLRHLVEVRQREIRELAELKRQKADLTEQMRQTQQQQATHRNQLEQRDQKLTELADDLRFKRGKLTPLIDEIQREQAAIKRSISDLQKLLGKVGKIPSPDYDQADRAFTAGQLPWPIQGTVQAKFGERRRGGGLRWQGLVIAGNTGDQVQAVHSGYIRYASQLKGWGMVVIVDHGNDYMSLYGYNRRVFKRQGEPVDTGERLAVLPASDDERYPPLLYFSILRQGNPIDPMKLLAKP